MKLKIIENKLYFEMSDLSSSEFEIISTPEAEQKPVQNLADEGATLSSKQEQQSDVIIKRFQINL